MGLFGINIVSHPLALSVKYVFSVEKWAIRKKRRGNAGFDCGEEGLKGRIMEDEKFLILSEVLARRVYEIAWQVNAGVDDWIEKAKRGEARLFDSTVYIQDRVKPFTLTNQSQLQFLCRKVKENFGVLKRFL